MSFNPNAAKAVTRIRDRLPSLPTVVELGSQRFTTKVMGREHITTTKQFFDYLGFSRYDTVDFNDDRKPPPP